jgi:hypothetical protein
MNKIEPELGDLLGATSASMRQVGGDHYKNLAIQPMEYSMHNKLNAAQHTAIKYITRYKAKGTPLEDLAKAKHCIDLLVQYELETTNVD